MVSLAVRRVSLVAGKRNGTRWPGYFAGMGTDQVAAIRNAIVDGADSETIAALPVPEVYRAAVVRAAEQEMFAGLASEDKDPRRSLHIDEVPVPELAPDEAYVAVMAS